MNNNSNWLEAAIGAVGNVLSSVTSTIGTKRAQKRQHKYNLELQNNAHQMAMEQMTHGANLQQENWETQFNMQNEYNSPEAQMQRLEDAGLNPAFSGEIGNQSSMGAAASAPSGSAPSPSAGMPNMPPMSPIGSDLINMYTALRGDKREQEKQGRTLDLMSAEIDNLLSQADLNIKQGNYTEKQGEEIDKKLKVYESQIFSNYQTTLNDTQRTIKELTMAEWQRKMDSVIQHRENVLAGSELEVDASIIQHNAAMGNAAITNASTARQKMLNDFEIQTKQLSQDYTKHKEQLAELKKKNFNDFVLKLLSESSQPIHSTTSALNAIGALETISEYLNSGGINGNEAVPTAPDMIKYTWDGWFNRRRILQAASQYQKALDAYNENPQDDKGFFGIDPKAFIDSYDIPQTEEQR